MVDEVLRNQFHPLIAIVSKNREGRYFNLWNRILAVVLSCIGVVPEDESVNSYETSLVSVPADCRRGKSESAWKSWRLHTLDVRMEHDRETNVEAIPR
jgi:hypothetical protein